MKALSRKEAREQLAFLEALYKLERMLSEPKGQPAKAKVKAAAA